MSLVSASLLPRWLVTLPLAPLTLTVLVLVALPAAVLTGCDTASESDIEAGTVFGLVTNDDELDQLETLVRGTEFESRLQNSSDFTLFAPTDFALDRLGADLVTRILGSPDIRLKLLRRHLVPRRLFVADLRDGDTLTPLEGPPLEVRIIGDRVFVGGARLTIRRTDFETSNGIVHYLDGVVRDHLSLRERLTVTPLASDFANVLRTAGLSDLLNQGEPYTLVIPITNAFDLFGRANLQELTRFENREILLKVLRRHVIPGRVRVSDLPEVGSGRAEIIPLGDFSIPVRRENGILYFGNTRVIAEEVATEDGVIYLTDRLMLDHLNVAERIQIKTDVETYFRVLREAGVLELLRGPGTYTAFLPSDKALADLGDSFVPALAARPDLLIKAAQYHIVPGKYRPEDLNEDMTLTTLGGYELQVQVGRDVRGKLVFVGGNGLLDLNPTEAGNGLIYSMSPLIYPPELNLEERAVFEGAYAFLGAMAQAGLTPLLQAEGPYTVFAPTDEAIAASNIPPSQLRRRMLYHIASGRYGVYVGSRLAPSLAGPDVSIEQANSPPTFYAFGPRNRFERRRQHEILDYDNETENGILHIIDGVMNPDPPPVTNSP